MQLSFCDGRFALHYPSDQRFAVFYSKDLHILRFVPAIGGSISHQLFAFDRPNASAVYKKNRLHRKHRFYLFRPHEYKGGIDFYLDSSAAQLALPED